MRLRGIRRSKNVEVRGTRAKGKCAGQIGDDHLQRQAGRVPQPDTFAHGTSEQRVRWFAHGYESGVVGKCDTFATERL